MQNEGNVDEVAWRKGHRYLTLVGDHRRRCVVWGCEGKGQAAADEFFAELDPPLEDPPAHAGQPSWEPAPAIMVPFGPCPTVPAGHGIQAAWIEPGSELEPAIFARANKLRAVSMDMTGGYAKSVLKHAPHATIVIDNYHVVQLASKALDEVRREHWNELRHAGQADTAKQFKADRWALLKNPNDLTDRQACTLAAIRAGGGKVARAWANRRVLPPLGGAVDFEALRNSLGYKRQRIALSVIVLNLVALETAGNRSKRHSAQVL